MLIEETWRWPNFTPEEMRCRGYAKGLCACDGMLPNAEFMDWLQTLREKAAFPFIVTSGARCPKYNSIVSQTGDNGPHAQGLAVDIQIRGERAFKLIELAIKYGVQGIGLSQKGPWASRYMHLDIVPGNNRLWSY